MKLTIPESWAATTVADLGAVVSGGTPSTKEPSYWNGTISWISPSDLTGYKSKFITIGAKSISQDGLKNSSAKVMPAGSVHFSSRAPIGYTVISTCEMTTNQGFKSLVPAQGVFNEFIFYYFKSAKQLAESNATGTTFKEISGTAFSKLPVPLPPLNEQHRIVAKIEELFSELEKGVESLKVAQQQLKVYRQSVLKAAFEGRLTEGWRKEHDVHGSTSVAGAGRTGATAGELESASELLARIKSERETRFEAQLAEWHQAVADWEAAGGKTSGTKKPAKPKKPKELPPLTADDLADLPDLPEGWGWIRFGDGVDISPNLVSPLAFQDSPHIAPDNIERKCGRLLPFRSIAEDGVTSPKHLFVSGQLLYSKIRPYLSKVALVNFDGLCSADMYPLQSNIYRHDFLLHLMLSKFFVEQASTAGSRSVLPKINQDELNKLIIPVMPCLEQHQIVQEIESRFSVVEKMEQTIDESLQKAEALRQSILKRAFEGKLVPQDPSDEPAAELLARIKTERAKVATSPRRKRKEAAA